MNETVFTLVDRAVTGFGNTVMGSGNIFTGIRADYFAIAAPVIGSIIAFPWVY